MFHKIKSAFDSETSESVVDVPEENQALRT